MLIEVIGNLRIKCTLTKEYLKSRWIDVDDLTYGSEAMNALFKDIIEETREKFGIDFTALENHPVMIEAVPMGEGSLSVFISKAEDAEELDTRFSRFSSKPENGGITPTASSDRGDDFADDDEGDEDEYETPRRIPRRKPVVIKSVPEFGKAFFDILEEEKEKIREGGCLVTVSFNKLSELIEFASRCRAFNGDSSVYKNRHDEKYLLVIPAEGEGFEEAMKFAENATEFGKTRIVPKSGAAFLDNNYDILIATGAIGKLRS
ncbi:MAG: adaptor protein MecA [Lachnospiraceae bacterium]|nr:adaptor protein MecA [Lachnospiraceae bacterium]